MKSTIAAPILHPVAALLLTALGANGIDPKIAGMFHQGGKAAVPLSGSRRDLGFGRCWVENGLVSHQRRAVCPFLG